ncbi:MAG TPA: hypothetical protein VJ065_03460 [Patescibacteria group bacterium]|nr:hypothetical protein [Patescibacteria group bacterium]
MDEDLLSEESVEEGKVDLLAPPESIAPAGAENFSMAVQRDMFLGGAAPEPATGSKEEKTLGKVEDVTKDTRTTEQKVENRDEPISQETIDEICNLMQRLPRLGDAYAFKIPYRTERRMPVEVLDEEIGLEVEAAYNPGGKHSPLRPTPGLTIVLSTPPLKGAENASISLDRMAVALRKIYGKSQNLDYEIRSVGNIVNSNDLYDRVKFELFCDEGGPILNEFSATSGKERPPVVWWEKSPRRPVLESGGHFLKGILERVVQKQIEEAGKNRLLTELAIEKVKDKAVPNDDSKVYEYAYHATRLSDLPGISELGLQPSGSDSKEPGTIFFTGWDSATVYQPEGENGEGVLYRFHIPDMPEIAKSWDFDNEEGLQGIGHSIATDQPIPPERLDFSLDSGKTWMPAAPRIKLKQAA